MGSSPENGNVTFSNKLLVLIEIASMRQFQCVPTTCLNNKQVFHHSVPFLNKFSTTFIVSVN